MHDRSDLPASQELEVTGQVAHLLSDKLTLCGQTRDEIIKVSPMAPVCRGCYDQVAPMVNEIWNVVNRHATLAGIRQAEKEGEQGDGGA